MLTQFVIIVLFSLSVQWDYLSELHVGQARIFAEWCSKFLQTRCTYCHWHLSL